MSVLYSLITITNVLTFHVFVCLFTYFCIFVTCAFGEKCEDGAYIHQSMQYVEQNAARSSRCIKVDK